MRNGKNKQNYMIHVCNIRTRVMNDTTFPKKGDKPKSKTYDKRHPRIQGNKDPPRNPRFRNLVMLFIKCKSMNSSNNPEIF